MTDTHTWEIVRKLSQKRLAETVFKMADLQTDTNMSLYEDIRSANHGDYWLRKASPPGL